VSLDVDDLRKAQRFDRAEGDLFGSKTDEGVTTPMLGEGSLLCLDLVG
jgi:hypothetical protein